MAATSTRNARRRKLAKELLNVSTTAKRTAESLLEDNGDHEGKDSSLHIARGKCVRLFPSCMRMYTCGKPWNLDFLLTVYLVYTALCVVVDLFCM